MRISSKIVGTLIVAASGCMIGGQAPKPTPEKPATANVVTPVPGETHFRTIRQITFGGENAEAYFSHDGKWLTLQSTRDGRACDQQYVMRIDGSGMKRIS